MSNRYEIGSRISYNGAVCTVRYVGEVKGTPGLCASKTVASFVRPTRPAEPPQSFLDAVREKYASEATRGFVPAKEIVISGKVAEEVGFDKIRTQQARLHELKIVIVDGLRVGSAVGDGEDLDEIAKTCPKIVELDLSRNLFTEFAVVRDVVGQLKHMRRLKLSGNRFQNILGECSLVQGAEKVFSTIKELALEETLLSWEEIARIASKFASLNTLSASGNQLTSITTGIPNEFLGKHLAVLNLEYNDFESIESLAPLSRLPLLRTLHLKGNRISSIHDHNCHGTQDDDGKKKSFPVFPRYLHYVDLSYNSIPSWSLIDALPTIFPGLTSLRLSHNPIYDHPDPVINTTTTTTSGSIRAGTTEEAHMLTIARLASLQTLNFASVSKQDRSNAEMFYLSRIGKQLSAVPAEQEEEVLAMHPRYEELCGVYGKPNVVRPRAGEDNVMMMGEKVLDGRLITVTFVGMVGGNGRGKEGEEAAAAAAPCLEQEHQEQHCTFTLKIPKSFDIYSVQGIAGRLFDIPALKTRLVWETDEWDPVAGFEEAEGFSSGSSDGHDHEHELLEVLEADSSADEEHQGHYDYHRHLHGPAPKEAAVPGQGNTRKKKTSPDLGRWVKREVELKQGPRKLGFMIDGQEARVRVEHRVEDNRDEAWELGL